MVPGVGSGVGFKNGIVDAWQSLDLIEIENENFDIILGVLPAAVDRFLSTAILRKFLPVWSGGFLTEMYATVRSDRSFLFYRTDTHARFELVQALNPRKSSYGNS